MLGFLLVLGFYLVFCAGVFVFVLNSAVQRLLRPVFFDEGRFEFIGGIVEVLDPQWLGFYSRLLGEFGTFSVEHPLGPVVSTI